MTMVGTMAVVSIMAVASFRAVLFSIMAIVWLASIEWPNIKKATITL